MELKIYNEKTLGEPLGQYSHVTRVKTSEFLFIAGMLSADFERRYRRRRRLQRPVRAGILEHRYCSQIRGRRLAQHRPVHDLSRSFARHP